MDRITKSLLEEFSTENSVTALPEDKQFELFSAFLCINKDFSDHFDTTEVATGSGGDCGIDSIAILANNNLVTDKDQINELISTNGYLEIKFIFVQSERSAGFDTSKIGQFGFGVNDFFKTPSTLPQNDTVKLFSSITDEIFRNSSKFKRGNPTCKLYYVTTGKWVGDANLEARRKAATEDLANTRLFSEVEFQCIGADEIQKLYSKTRNAVQREFFFSEKVTLDIPGVSESYIGVLPSIEFIKLIEDEDGKILKGIFYDNVRDWQDFNEVNSEMRDTLFNPDTKARFALMNNGITIITKNLRTTGNKFVMEDYQIVNGCQTSHVLHSQKSVLDETVTIPVRIVATTDDGVISGIIKATNRQTEIAPEQILAYSDFQKKLEAYFLSYGQPNTLYYERRSRQWATGVEKTRIITPTNLIRAYASFFLDEPHRTTRDFKSLTNRLGKDIFKSDDRLEPYFVSAYCLYKLDYLFRNYSINPKFKPARYHILMALKYLKGFEPLPRMNSHEMGRYCETWIKLLFDNHGSQSVFETAIAAVDDISNDNFDSNIIRTAAYTEKLKLRIKEMA